MKGVHLRKYGVEATIDFEVYGIDGIDLKADWVPAQADCEIMKDGGSSTMCTNTATDEGSTFSIVLTATEMEAARLVLKVVDAVTKVILDTVVIIETYGNASAQHAFDLDTASSAQTGDSYAIVNSGTYGNAKLVRSTTPANTFDVNANGEGGIDWANVGGQGTAVDLSATSIDLCDQVTACDDTPSVPSAADVADAVWEEAIVDHSGTAGSTAELLQDIDDEVDFIHDAVQGLSVSGAPLRAVASGNTLTTGTQSSGTYADTQIENSTYHVITNAGGVILNEYAFNIGTFGVPTNLQLAGYLKKSSPPAGSTSVSVYAWDYVVTNDWELVAPALFVSITGDIPGNHNPGLLARHVDTNGDMRIRFSSTGLAAGTAFYLDLIAVTYAEALSTSVAAILADTNELQAEIGVAGAGLTDLGGMSTAMKAEVNAEAKDVLNTDTYAEPAQGAPGATVSLAAKLSYLYKAWRNKSTQDATTFELYNDAGAVVDHKATVGEAAGVVTKGEVETGP